MRFLPKIGRVMRVYGHSMMPTLRPGGLVLVQEREFETRPPRRGEVVAATPAAFGGRPLVKRLAGLPHDRITVDGHTWDLQDDQYFLLGDQPEHSADSRIFGPVTGVELVGPVRLQVWPWRFVGTCEEEASDGQGLEVS
jgi:signal peptidase I